jgi:DNA-binding CsgD family transcriptional regulator/tetratricopeptide (TPR) repeat protein
LKNLRFRGAATAGRLSAPVLVGRDAEVAELRAAWQRADGGQPTTVFVGGEAGVGKSRLVREFVGPLPDLGVQVWAGYCLPLADGLIPYAPIVDILRGVAADVGVLRLRELAGPMPARLAMLLPELGADASDIASQPGPGEGGLAGMYTSLLSLVEALGEQPTVLVVEDLHWADASTRDILVALWGGMRRGRVLLVCTHRDDELPPDHPLSTLLVELGRSGANRLRLDRLRSGDTAAQIAAIRGSAPDPELVLRVLAQSGGNPFFVEELLAAGPAADALPESLRQILLLRVRRLPASAQRVVQAVAFAGGRAAHALVSRIVGLPPDDMDAATRMAVEQYVLQADDDGYAFRHALVAEAVRADALPGARIAAHRALAEALTERLPRPGAAGALGPDSVTAAERAEVAYHWYAAGEVGPALVAAVEAGLSARRAGAFPECRRHLERALELWERAGEARDTAALDLLDLYWHAADAANLSGDADGALVLARKGIAVADASADPVRLAMLHVQLGGFLASSASGAPGAVTAFQTAVHLVPDTATGDRARVLAGLAAILTLDLRQREARALAERALQVAEHAGARSEMSYALTTLGLHAVRHGQVEPGLAQLRRALSIADQSGLSYDQFRACFSLTRGLTEAGRFVEAVEVAQRGIDRAHRNGVSTYADMLQAWCWEAMYLLGRWSELGEQIPDRPQPRGHLIASVTRWGHAVPLHAAQGRYEQAQRFVDACLGATAAGGFAEPAAYINVVHAELCLSRGEPDAAHRWASQALSLADGSDHLPILARALAAAARAEADLNQHRGTRSGERPTPIAADLLTRLTASISPTPYVAAQLAFARAELSRTGDANAVDAWTTAADRWARLHSPHPVAYARYRLAEAMVTVRARRHAAARHLSQAHETAVRLEATPLRHDIEALARRARLELDTPAPDRVPPRARTDVGLTQREEQVLVHLAQGSTNRQIAKALFISEKTVAIHVSRILTKLGVSNRSGAAATARHLGLDIEWKS